MSFVAIPNAWRVALQGDWSGGGTEWVSTFGILDAGTHDVARANAIGLAVRTWWNGTYKPIVGNTVRLNSVYILDQSTSTGPAVTYVTGLPVVGTRAGDPVPSSTCFRVTLLTGLRGRANRGRMFLPGGTSPDINDVDGTSWDPAYVAAATPAIAALGAAITALPGAAAVAVLSRSQSLAIPVTSWGGHSQFGTQRRRRGGS
jgi:hypothetical protein